MWVGALELEVGIDQEPESERQREESRVKNIPAFLKGQSHTVFGSKKKKSGRKSKNKNPHSVCIPNQNIL